MSQHSNNVRSAAALINAVATLLFWLRQLPLHLPTPRCDNEIYTNFYNTMQQVHFLTQQFPQAIPRTTSVDLLTVHAGQTSRDSVPLKGSVPVPPPLPKHRPPRASSTAKCTAVSDVQVTAPEAPDFPAPQPIPERVRSRRKSFFPAKLFKLD